MATKLKNLKVTKVDFVDDGANPDAHIRLFKRKEDPGITPAGGTPDSEKNPKFWGRVFGAIAKAFSSSEDFDSALAEIEKGGAETFGEKYAEYKNRKVADEIWDICYALQSSICSILCDEELDGTAKQNAMTDSLTEFDLVIEEAIKQWSGGKLSNIVTKGEPATEAEIEIMKDAKKRLESMIEKAAVPPEGNADGGPQKTTSPKGDEKEMRIDKSKLTEAEKAFLDSIEKRYGTEEPGENTPAAPAAGTPSEGIEKGNTPAAPEGTAPVTPPASTPASAGSETDDIYKGLHPAVRAEMEALRKFREESENRELAEVAKKYAIIGKKEEELVPLLKSLRAAGGTAYADMIALMDSAVSAVEKSGAFGEIGKNGHQDPEGGSWAQAEARATELMKSKTGITKQQALDEVFKADPELAAKCEKEE